jgi:hypothetical protein
MFLVSSLVSGRRVRASDFATARVSCSSLCTKLSAMDEPYPEMEELLYYEEEEEAAPDIVAAKTNGKTVKK